MHAFGHVHARTHVTRCSTASLLRCFAAPARCFAARCFQVRRSLLRCSAAPLLVVASSRSSSDHGPPSPPLPLSHTRITRALPLLRTPFAVVRVAVASVLCLCSRLSPLVAPLAAHLVVRRRPPATSIVVVLLPYRSGPNHMPMPATHLPMRACLYLAARARLKGGAEKYLFHAPCSYARSRCRILVLDAAVRRWSRSS
jgi:hypothetical protein